MQCPVFRCPDYRCPVYHCRLYRPHQKMVAEFTVAEFSGCPVYRCPVYRCLVFRCPVYCLPCRHRSAGLTVEGGATGNSNVPRQVTCPPGETAVSDMALSSTGEIMYSAAGNTVRIWDLRTYARFLLSMLRLCCSFTITSSLYHS